MKDQTKTRPKIISPKLSRAIYSLLLILFFTSINFLSFFLMTGSADAGQLSNRKVTLGSSKTSTSNTYSVSFIPASTTSIKGIVVDFCNAAAGPLIGTACSSGNHTVTGIQTSGTVSVTQTSGFGSVNFTAQTPGGSMPSGKALVMTSAAGTGGSTDTVHAVTFSFSATNPSTVASFYGRIITFSTTADATTYDSTTTGAANPGSNTIDQGSVALSTANELTTTARVNEILQFCVGTTSVDDATTTIGTNCSSSFTGNCGTTVNLGTLDPGAVSISPVPTAAGAPGGGNACNGAAMVLTNASNGIIVTYFAEQESSSGKLKVVGASCSGSSTTDQCFNDSSTQGLFTSGIEKFGLTVGGTNCNGTSTPSYSCSMSGATNQLVATSGYIGRTTTQYCDAITQCNSAGNSENGFAWLDTGSTAQLAASTGPVDNETLVLKFAATPSVTTPTGSYSVISNYIATATF